MTVRDKGSNKCLRDLGDQIPGKFKSLEVLQIIYPIYQEKTSYEKLGTGYAGRKPTLTHKVFC